MDITSIIQKAIELNQNWKHSDFITATEILLGYYQVDIEINYENLNAFSAEDFYFNNII